MTYEGQTQVGNDNTDNLTKCDYIVSSISTPSNGEASFQFKHMGALARFVLTVPEDATFKEFILSSDEEIFPVSLVLQRQELYIARKFTCEAIYLSFDSCFYIFKQEICTLLVDTAYIICCCSIKIIDIE